MNKSQIITNLNKEHFEFWKTATNLPNANVSLNEKWSVSKNVEHINIALLRVSNFLALPKLSIKSNFGLSERKSTNYETITEGFKNTFENGVKSTDDFIPKINLDTSITELVNQGKKSLSEFISNLQNWSEEDLETYNCPHPVLGKITVREILYFTVYHVQHHHKTIKKMK